MIAKAATLLALGVVAWHSLTWTMAVDAPLLAYAAFAIDQLGLAPYRDLVDFNTPGAYFANIAIGRIFGYSEMGFRLADLTALALLSSLTAVAVRPFGGRAMFVAPLLFAGFYFGYGPVMSLQREYFLLLPLAGALASTATTLAPEMRAGVIGLMIGCAITIKPQAAIVMPIFLAWIYEDAGRESRSRRIELVLAVVACAAPIAAAAAWVTAAGGGDAFLAIARDYWPLYNQLTGARPHHIVTGAARLQYILIEFVWSRDLRHLVLLPAIAGIWVALTQRDVDARQRQQVWLLTAFAVAMQIYPAIAGKYWAYHWLPAIYAASILSALSFGAWRDLARQREIVPALIVVLVAAQWVGIMREVRWSVSEVEPVSSRNARDIAAVIQPRLRPGDTVQPLDWTGGAVHALLLMRARIATPFLYDFYFYHHVSHPPIQQFRRSFIEAVSAARPAFIVAADQQRRLEGQDTTYQFDELSAILRRDYRAVAANESFAVYERNDHVLQP